MEVIDFFCGAGGMTFGMSKAGINVLAGIDIDPECKETYVANNPKSKFIEIDVHNLSEKKLSELTGIKKDDDSLLFICCSPCQYWTKINTEKKTSKKTKNLLGEFQRFVSWYHPGYLVIENVPGLFTNKKEKVLARFLKFLKNEGYHFDHDLVSATDYGVPQSRRRFLLVASRVSKDIKLPDKEKNDKLAVRNFIGTHNGFCSIEDGQKDNTDFLHTTAALSEKNKKRIRMTPKNGGTRMSWKNDPDLQIPTYKGKDNIFGNVYGRMFWDKPAPTLTTKFHSLSNGRFGHPGENRAISLREGATLQTFPKTYIFKGTSKTSIARQIGNAVPVELAYRVGKHILKDYRNLQDNKNV